jgi:multidrug efflux pump subunit AcrA (membrane-fusion protein)
MKPITVSTTVQRPRDEVFAHLDVLANHVPFNDHYMADPELSGPATGAGGRMHARILAPGRSQRFDLETITAQAPDLLVERTVAAGGKRRTRGTYRLAEAGAEATTVTFELVVEAEPAIDKPLAPLARRWMAKQLQRAMDRLKEQVETAPVAA